MFTYGRTASVYNDCFCSVPLVNLFCKHFHILNQNDTHNILGNNSEIMLSIELCM